MIKIKNISKIYIQQEEETIALDSISMQFENNGLYAIVGKSGSGKSTLLNIIGLLEKPNYGDLIFNSQNINYHDEKECEKLRVNDLSFVFQDFNLLFDFNVVENIKIVGLDSEKEIREILSLVGLEDKILTPVRYLSGGEKQRLSIARAVAKKSKILLLDEPTGNLDKANTENIFKILKRLSVDKLIILVTHDLTSAYKYSDNVYQIESGKVSEVWISPFNQTTEFIINDNTLNTVNEISNFLQPLISSESFVLKGELDNKAYEIEVNSTNFINNINTLVKNHVGEKIRISILKEMKTEYEGVTITPQTSSSFSFQFLIKYALILILKNKKRFFNTFVLMSLSLLLVFLYMSIINFDKNSSVFRAINSTDISIIPIESSLYNEYTNEFTLYNSGKFLFERYENYGISTYYLTDTNHDYILSDDDNKLDLTVVITNDSLSKVTISDFALKYIFNTDILTNEVLSIKNNRLNVQNLNFEVSDVFDTGYSISRLNSYLLDQDYYLDNIDHLKYYYNTVFISQNIYNDAFKNKILKLNAANFIFSNETTAYYTASYNDLRYAKYSNENLIKGRAPITKSEVVITQRFYDDYLSNDSINNVLGSEYFYKDLYNLPNSNLYQNKMNMYAVENSIKIVGIVEGDISLIYTSSIMFDAITASISSYYIDGIVLHNGVAVYNEIVGIHSNGDKLRLISTLPVYNMDNLIDNTTDNILLTLGIIFMAITILSSIQYTSIAVTSKYKEIAIFRSLGKSKKSISLIFYIHNLIQSLVSFVVSSIFGVVVFILLNELLRGEEFLSINYPIFDIHWTSLLVPLVLSTFIILISTTVSILGSLKNDINIIIKNS